MTAKTLLRALKGETLPVPPIWLMRQAGRYLPEYRETREKAGDFLSLCYSPDLAAEVTLQPIRRFGFDAAILFADILLVPHALGSDLWFDPGEGPRLSTTSTPADLGRLRRADDINERLSPVYQTVQLLAQALPPEVALIGFAGAPWTVATYMVAGRGTPDQGPAHRLKESDEATFAALIDRLTEATIEYLSAQIAAGAEAVKLFDSWAGSLQGKDFDRWCLEPITRIVSALKARHPEIPVIAFPRGAGVRYAGFAAATGADCVALDQSVPLDLAIQVQGGGCVQGNLDPAHLVTGGDPLDSAARNIIAALGTKPFVFNLGHGITPDADPGNVSRLVEVVRGG
jgi:uroporphyrinogen decarboxylase